jgi:excisionase family DNA binding protein
MCPGEKCSRTHSPMNKHLLNVVEVAELLRISPRATYRAAERGDLPALRIGRLLRFDAEEVLAALRQSRDKRP